MWARFHRTPAQSVDSLRPPLFPVQPISPFSIASESRFIASLQAACATDDWIPGRWPGLWNLAPLALELTASPSFHSRPALRSGVTRRPYREGGAQRAIDRSPGREAHPPPLFCVFSHVGKPGRCCASVATRAILPSLPLPIGFQRRLAPKISVVGCQGMLLSASFSQLV